MRRLIYLLAIAFGLSFWSQEISDPDLGWHLFGGAWISIHNSLPTFDPINTFNSTWHDYHWLVQLLLFKLYTLGGYPLLRLCHGLLMAYLFKVILDIIIHCAGKKTSTIVITFYLICAMVFIAAITSIRPQMLALCILALALRRLLKKPSTLEIPYLFLLTVVLANFHVYWIFIPFLWSAYRLLPAYFRHKNLDRSHAWLGLAVLMLSGFISPYSYQSYTLLLDYASTPEWLRNFIDEFKSSLRAGGTATYLFVASLIIAARIFKPKRFLADLSNSLTFIVTAMLALRSVKFLSVYAICGLPFLVRHCTAALRRYLAGVSAREPAFVKVVMISLLAVSTITAAINLPFRNAAPNKESWYNFYPIDACKALAHAEIVPLPTRDHVRILTHFNHGGWCRWILHTENPDKDFRVTTDGRTQFVPIEQFQLSSELYSLKSGWQDTLQKWDPDAAVISRQSSLGEMLLVLPNWKILFEDKNFRVFSPTSRIVAVETGASSG